MKIAYVVSSLKVSMTFVVNELEAHEKAGWQVLPLVSCKPGPLENLSEVMVKWNKQAVFRPNVFVQSIVTLREIITHPLRFARICFWLVTLLVHSPLEFAKALYELTISCYFAGHCRRFSAEHIHVHFASRSLSLGLMIGMLTDLPISCTVHAFDIFTRSPGSLQTRLAKCKFIAAVSQFNVEYLRNTCGNSVADLCRVVHCGIDAEKFRSVSHQPEPGRIICVCRLSPKKGLDVAIRACAKLRDNNVKFLFEIAGDGPQRRALEELIGRLHLADNVKLLGARPNDQLAELFSRACVFLMPCIKMPDGDMDGIPVAMMEAMACEVPVVSTNISGIPELVKDGLTGRLTPEKNADALAQILKELLEDMDKIEQFGKAGRERVLKDFCISQNAAKLRELMLDARCWMLDTRRESRIENRESRMHILYIHQHFATPAGSTGTRSYEFARRWVRAGHKVTMIAGHYDIGGLQVSGALYRKLNIEGINVVVVGTKYSNKQSYLRRVTSFLSFCLLGIYVGLRTKGVDVIYASSTPLTVGIPATVIKWLKHIPFVFEVRDQWPEIPIELNIITNGFLIKILLWLEKTIYRNCSSIIALSPGQADGIRKVLTSDNRNRGLTEEKPITVIPNSCDIDMFRPDIDGSIVRQRKGWGDKLVLLHTGAMGKVNGLDFVINAAEMLKDHSNIIFVLIGDGKQKPSLESRVKKLALTNVEILSSVPKRELSDFYAAADIGLVIIGNFPIIEHNSANKFFDSLSAGKPVLLNYSGWQRKILKGDEAGFGCTLCNLDEFVEKVLYLKSHIQQVEKMGQNARRVAIEKFNRDDLAAEALEVVSKMARQDFI